MTTIVYIHGASASGSSFNYIRHHIDHQDELVIEYDSARGFDRNLDDIQLQIKDHNEIFFVAHSLGGIYSLHLADRLQDRVVGAVTLSTPYNGAESADYIKHFLPYHRLFNDIGPKSGPIKSSHQIRIQHPWVNVVSTSGATPLIIYPNDGVVTINSMKCRSDMELIDLPVNHYEIVLKSETVKIIREKIDGLFI
jgi:pimeloyl-ACP methyl ester carboxylesterase